MSITNKFIHDYINRRIDINYPYTQDDIKLLYHLECNRYGYGLLTNVSTSNISYNTQLIRFVLNNIPIKITSRYEWAERYFDSMRYNLVESFNEYYLEHASTTKYTQLVDVLTTHEDEPQYVFYDGKYIGGGKEIYWCDEIQNYHIQFSVMDEQLVSMSTYTNPDIFYTTTSPVLKTAYFNECLLHINNFTIYVDYVNFNWMHDSIYSKSTYKLIDVYRIPLGTDVSTDNLEKLHKLYQNSYNTFKRLYLKF